jgi:sodium-dependent dicarboxylate transporter 2/3/5
MNNYYRILIALISSIIIFFITQFFYTLTQAAFIGVIALLIILWTNNGLPMGAVSLFPLLFFPMFGILGFNQTAENYANPTIFLFLGGFLIAISTEKIGLHTLLVNRLLKIFPKSNWGIIFSVGLTATLLSSFLSNSTTALLLLPVVFFLTEYTKLKTRLLLATAYGASIGGIITPIGTPPNLILLGFLQANNLPQIPFFQWIVMVFPLSFIMLLFMSIIMTVGLKKDDFKIPNTEEIPATKEQKRLIYIIISLFGLLILNSPIKPIYSGLGLNENAVLLAYGILMFIPKIGFLEWKDFSKIPFEIIFLFGAGFSIGAGFSSTGLSNILANYLLGAKSLDLVLLIGIISLGAILLTEITSNTALISLLLPILFSLSKFFPLNINLLILFTATLSASYAFMLPIATPPNAIVMSKGYVKISDMLKFGVPLDILGVILTVLFARYFWLLIL